MATVSITKSAAPTTPQAIPKPKGVRLTCDEVTHPWFSYLAASRYNSSSDAASDINIQETIVATGKYQNKLFDSAELTRGTAYWWRIYWVDIYGNESIKAAAQVITYRGSNTGDLENDAATPAKVKQIDRTNAVRDSDCEDTSLFSGSGGTLSSIAMATVAESANYLYIAAATGELSISTKVDKANAFPVKAGKKYYASLTLGKRDTGAATYAAYVLWYSMDAAGALTLLGNSLIGTHSTNQTTQEEIVTAPASARRAVLIGYKNSGSNGDLAWYGPIFRKAASGEQIPDGDVTDVKIGGQVGYDKLPTDLDTTNLFKNPAFRGGNSKGYTGNSWSIITRAACSIANAPAPYVASIAPNGTYQQIWVGTNSSVADSFDVTPGEVFHARLYGAATANCANGSLQLVAVFDNGTGDGVYNYAVPAAHAVAALASGGVWAEASGFATVPATVNGLPTARMSLYVELTNAATVGTSVFFTKPKFRRASSTDQIPNGNVTDAKADQTAPGTPTGLAVSQTAKTVDTGDGRVEIGLKATWTAPASGVAVRRYKVEISDGTDTWYDTTKASSYKFWGVVSKTYTVKVNAESFSGVEGSQTSGVALAPSANTVAGSVPTWESGTQIVAKPKGNMLRFVMPADKDFDQVSIWRNTVNNSGTATEIGRTRSNRYKDDENLIAGQAYFYFLKGINRSAVLTSSFSAASSITARGTQSDDIEPLAVIPSKINIGDPSNMVFDGDMTDLTEWLTDGTGLALIGTGLVAEASNRLITTASTSVIGMRQVRSMQVKAGKKYYASAYFGVHSGAESTTFNLYVQWFSMDSSGVETFLSNSLVATYTGTGQTTGTAIVTAPANARRAWFLLVKTATTTAVAPTLGAPVFRKAVEDDLLDSTAPGTPTSLALTQVAKNTDAGDGTVEIALRATWTAPVGGVAVKRYILEISDGTDTWYRYSRQSSEKFPFVVGKNCTINVRAESFAGVEGSPTSNVVKTDVGGKTTAPGSPSAVSIVVKAGQNKIKWTAPTDKDIAGFNVYFNSTNNSGTATKIASEVKTDDYVDATVRTAGATCYYWIAAVNRSGVEGSKIAASNNPQSARRVQTADIEPAVVTTTEIAPTAVTPSKLFPREYGNLFSDPELLELTNFAVTVGTGALSQIGNTGTIGFGPGRFILVQASATELVKEITGPLDIPVEAGLSYVVDAWIGGTSAKATSDNAAFTPAIYIDWYSVNTSGNPTTLISTTTITGTVNTLLPELVKGEVTAPAQAQVARLRFRKTRASVSTTNTLYVASPQMRRQVLVEEVKNGVMQKPGYNYIGGFAISRYAGSGDLANDVQIGPGVCSDSGNATGGGIELVASLVKRIDSSWVAGNNQGGMDTGTVADGVYHLWVIANPDSGAEDVLFSLSPSSPTMPTGYTKKRRIGSIIRSGGANLDFSQNGNEFLLISAVLDVDVSNQGTSAVTRTLTVPTGIQVDALVRMVASNASSYNVLLSSLDVADAAPSGSASPLATTGGTAGVSSRTEARVRTNTSGQIRSRSDTASTTLRIATYGWIDYRGQS